MINKTSPHRAQSVLLALGAARVTLDSLLSGSLGSLSLFLARVASHVPLGASEQHGQLVLVLGSTSRCLQLAEHLDRVGDCKQVRGAGRLVSVLLASEKRAQQRLLSAQLVLRVLHHHLHESKQLSIVLSGVSRRLGSRPASSSILRGRFLFLLDFATLLVLDLTIELLLVLLDLLLHELVQLARLCWIVTQQAELDGLAALLVMYDEFGRQ